MNGGIEMNQLVIGKYISLKRKQKNMTQEQLAEKLGVSNKTISKWETGKCMPDYSIIKNLCDELEITVSKYVTYLRLEHAKQLLQNSDIPVTEVAMLSGYQNVSYFIRSFKKTYGVSPLKYRKNEPSTWI